jgi:hypothetical protein
MMTVIVLVEIFLLGVFIRLAIRDSFNKKPK